MAPGLVTRCRDILLEVARQQGTITYGDLAAHIGIANQGPWDVPNEIIMRR